VTDRLCVVGDWVWRLRPCSVATRRDDEISFVRGLLIAAWVAGLGVIDRASSGAELSWLLLRRMSDEGHRRSAIEG